MNIQLPMHMEKSAFLAWVEGREGRYELDGGRVVMMTGGSRAHSQIIGNLFRALDKRLDSDTWAILADFGVDVGPNSIRYPDIVVEPVSDTPRDLTAIAPVLVIEVLSPSNQPRKIQRHRLAAFSGGTREFWVVDPAGQTVEVSLPGSSSVIYTVEDLVPVTVLPGVALPLRKLFEV